MPRRDISGEVFGRLTAIRRTGVSKGGQAIWLCQCYCGKTSNVSRGNLISGDTRSCGCLKSEVTTARSKTHGEAGAIRTAEYQIWASMIQRCRNPKSRAFSYYGGRGIDVCSRWMAFENFIADIGHRPTPSHTLERVDNELGYTAENCVWASRRTQSRNTRHNRTIQTPYGRMMLCDAANVSGLSPQTIAKRIARGWPVVDLFKPPQPRGNRLPRLPGQTTATRK
jgi:hypothetical protein